MRESKDDSIKLDGVKFVDENLADDHSVESIGEILNGVVVCVAPTA